MALGDFSDQADAYQQARPAYPQSLLIELLQDAAVVPGDPVADLGAGTGLLTTQLAAMKLSVTAVEPNEAMLNRADNSGAVWLAGSFESCPLPDSSQAWAVAAQAFHWADPARALPEIRRVLQPRRLFTVLWNNRAIGECETVNWTEEAIVRHVPEYVEAYRNRPWEEILESTGDFRFRSRHVHRHYVTMDHQRYLNLWRSHNRLNNIAGPVRFNAFFRELTDYLSDHQVDSVNVPYDCETWSAERTE